MTSHDERLSLAVSVLCRSLLPLPIAARQPRHGRRSVRRRSAGRSIAPTWPATSSSSRSSAAPTRCCCAATRTSSRPVSTSATARSRSTWRRSANGDFAAITFRRQSFTNHENIYLRLRRSGDFMAMQYAPRVNGSSTWQLYREFAVATDWPREQWTHVRVEVAGSKMDVFTGDAKTPMLTVPRLRNGTTGGEIGFWARVNDRPLEWAAAISNLQITHVVVTGRRWSPPANAPVQFVWNWQVSDPVPADGAVRSLPPAIAKWTRRARRRIRAGQYQSALPRSEGPLGGVREAHHPIGRRAARPRRHRLQR